MKSGKKYVLRSAVCIAVLVCLILAVFTGCGTREQEVRQFKSLSDFDGTVMGALTGAPYEKMMAEDFHGLTWKYYDDAPTGFAAVKKGDIDAFVTDAPITTLAAAKSPEELAVFPDSFNTTDFAMVMKKGGELVEPVSQAIRELREEGVLQELQEKWFSGDDERMVIHWENYNTEPRPGGVLRYYYDPGNMPMTYADSKGRAAGLESELALMIADKLDMGIEMHTALLPSVMLYVQTGKGDLGAGCLTVTDERKESMDFCESYYRGGATLLCRKSNLREILAERDSVDLKAPGTVIAYEVGTITEEAARKAFPEAEYMAVSDAADGFLAVSSKKATAFAADKVVFEKYMQSSSEKLRIYENKTIGETGRIAAGISRVTELPDAEEKINRFLREITENGILEDMQQRWIFDGNYEMPESEVPENPQVTLKIGTTVLLEPYSFFQGETLTGMDLELALRFAAWCNAGVEVSTYDWGGLVTACGAGKVDYIFSNLMDTPERRESVDFSIPYGETETVLVVSAETEAAAHQAQKSITEKLIENFQKTFVRENRWKLILSGLLVTLEISVFAGALGTLLGFGICLCLRSKVRILSGFFRGFCGLIQGIPSLVVLMIANFVIFGSVTIPPVLVGIFSFSIVFAVSVSGILNTGIGTIDPGQWEAASSLGFGKVQTFVKIILP